MERDIPSRINQEISLTLKPITEDEGKILIDITHHRQQIFTNEVEAIDFFDKEAQKFRLIGWGLRLIIVMGLASSAVNIASGINNGSLLEVGSGALVGGLMYVIRTINQRGVMERMKEDIFIAEALRDYEAKNLSSPLEE